MTTTFSTTNARVARDPHLPTFTHPGIRFSTAAAVLVAVLAGRRHRCSEVVAEREPGDERRTVRARDDLGSGLREQNVLGPGEPHFDLGAELDGPRPAERNTETPAQRRAACIQRGPAGTSNVDPSGADGDEADARARRECPGRAMHVAG